MRDISTSKGISSDIFRLVLDQGPLTLYQANQKSSLAIGTIHRHLKQLEGSAKIKPYNADGKRNKIAYGPTVFGFVFFYDDIQIRASVENYFLRWADRREFLEDLQAEGFDKNKISENQHTYKKIFASYIQFFSAVETSIDSITKGESDIPRDILIFISSALLTKNPKYQKIWEELYINLPALRKSLDEYINNTVSSYKEFKKNMRPKIKG